MQARQGKISPTSIHIGKSISTQFITDAPALTKNIYPTGTKDICGTAL